VATRQDQNIAQKRTVVDLWWPHHPFDTKWRVLVWFFVKLTENRLKKTGPGGPLAWTLGFRPLEVRWA
jgi:hypothetical protein